MSQPGALSALDQIAMAEELAAARAQVAELERENTRIAAANSVLRGQIDSLRAKLFNASKEHTT